MVLGDWECYWKKKDRSQRCKKASLKIQTSVFANVGGQNLKTALKKKTLTSEMTLGDQTSMLFIRISLLEA